MIVAEKISKSWDKHLIFANLDLKVSAGETLAICGPSGSGKSTLLHVLSGFTSADSGHVELLGKNLDCLSNNQLYAHLAAHVGLVEQKNSMIAHLNLWENICLGLDYQQDLLSKTDIEALMQTFGLASLANRLPLELSAGEMQRGALVRALAKKPQLLLLDEPSSALDPPRAQQVFDFILQWCSQQATAAIIVSHDWQLCQQCQQTLWFPTKNAYA